MDAIEPPQAPANTMPQFDGIPESPASPVPVDAEFVLLSFEPLQLSFGGDFKGQPALADERG